MVHGLEEYFQLTKQAIQVKFGPFERVYTYRADGLDINPGDKVYVGKDKKEWLEVLSVSTDQEDLDKATVSVDVWTRAEPSKEKDMAKVANTNTNIDAQQLQQWSEKLVEEITRFAKEQQQVNNTVLSTMESHDKELEIV